MSAPALRVRAADVAYGAARVLREVDLELAAGELHALLGRSGSGKTTLLRAIAGFTPLAAGRIELHGVLVDDGARWTPPEARGVGVVFQDFALFPHLDVARNVAFGCTAASARERARVAGELIEQVGLSGYERRHVSDLSGGEQQRVALARALAQSPRLIVLDEPFSSLNRELRRGLREATAQLLRARGIAGLFVTHDAEEAFSIADRVSVLHAGRVLQTDSPRALYTAPCSLEVARSVGDVVVLAARAEGTSAVRCALGVVPVRRASAATAHVLLRPEQLRVRAEHGAAASSAVEERAVILRARRFLGAAEELTLELPSGERALARLRTGELEPDALAVSVEIDGLGVALDASE